MVDRILTIIILGVFFTLSVSCSSKNSSETTENFNENTVQNCFVTGASGTCKNGETVTADGSGCNADRFVSCNEAKRDAHLDLEAVCANKGGLESEDLGSCDCETRDEC